MKNTAANLNVISIDETEAKLLKMKELDHQMKVLKASFDKLKEEVLNSYFVNNEEFVGSEGLVLATYKSQIRNTFMSSEFKKDHADTYKLYSADQTINVFLLKK